MAVKKFKRKPTVIEAQRFNGGERNATDILNWLTSHDAKGSYWKGRVAEGDTVNAVMPEEFHVETPKGMMIARPGDWIVRNAEGIFYPTKHENLEKKYESA